jgi:Tfp pilus assembly protein PilN
MTFRRPRLALVLLGDRLVAASVQGARLETFLVDSEQPATTLRAEIDQRRLAVRTVALGLPRGAVTVKPIELPDVGGELRDMVQFELERHVPFPADDASFDFVELPAETDGAPAGSAARRVLIAVADRRVVDGALRLTEETRLRPSSLTVAVHDLPALVPSRTRGHVVWMHRVGETTALVFLADGQIVLSRSVTSDGDEAIAAEIERSLAIVRWRSVDAIWASGDEEGLDTRPRALLGVAVTEPPYTARARALLAQSTGVPAGAGELALAVAVGSRRARPLQLLPPRLRPRRLTRQQLVALGAAAAVVILGITALVIPGYRENRRLSGINRRIAKLDGEVRTVEQTLQELERKRRLLATIQSLDSTAVRPLPVLRELTELVPTDAWLTSVSVDPKGLELTGQAAAASALIPLLENSPRLERAEFASPVTRGRDKEQFRIRASWETPAVAAVAKPAPAPTRDAQRPRAPSSTPSGDITAPAPRRAPDAPPFPGVGGR